MTSPTDLDMRRCTLAVSVLHDLDLEPARLGVTLPGSPSTWVSWGECRRALAATSPESEAGRHRLADHLRARRWCADAGPALADQLRPVGLPIDHALHPGADWVRERVLGGALELGLGAVGLDPDAPDRVVLVPTPALLALGLSPEFEWVAARSELKRLGTLAVERLLRDPRGLLRPYGDCDAVTLLGARSLRSALAAVAGGMAAAVVPMRTRGWTRLASIDPAFGPAAAAATDPAERGFSRPLLLTADELAVVPEGGRPATIVLLDPVKAGSWDREVLYR